MKPALLLEAAKQLWKDVQENHKRIDSCAGHVFVDTTPEKALGKRWKCTACGDGRPLDVRVGRVWELYDELAHQVPAFPCFTPCSYQSLPTESHSPWTRRSRFGMTLDELREHIQEEYGNEGLRELPERLARVEAKGVSAWSEANPEDVIVCNRAGTGETRLTMEQLVDYFCERQGTGERPTGTKR